MVGMLKQSVDKIASPAIRFVLCAFRGQKVSNLVVGRRVAWKDAGAYIIGHCETNDDTRKKIPVDRASLRIIGMEKCSFPSSSTVLDLPIPDD